MRLEPIAAALLCVPAAVAAQYYQTDFPAEEFRTRHAQVFAKIDNAVAVVQGVHQTEGFTLPRQHNTFYYLSGIETPGAYLLLDGRTKKVTIYLPPRNQRLSVDPQLWVRDENLNLRYEDTVVVTGTGVENSTDFLPSELADIEKLVQETGAVQTVPPIPAAAVPRR